MRDLTSRVSPESAQTAIEPNPVGPIAICTIGELFGGVERHVLGMLCGLRGAGIATQLILFHDGELAAQARAQGDEPVMLSGSNQSLPITARHLAHLLAQQHISVVHVHGYKAAVFTALAKLWHNFAIVKTEHGLPEPAVGGRLRTLRNRAYYTLDAMAMRAADATICYVTRDLQTFHRSSGTETKTTVIPNGVAPMNPNDYPRPPEYNDGRLNFAIVGRLDPVKGHRFAIRALAAVDNLRDIHLQIIGTGPSEAELRELVESLGVSEQVHFLGFRRNIYDYIAHCDAMLMPSLHEGLPYSLLEAMAFGCPIVASSVGGLQEILEHGHTALLVPAGDAQALAQTLSVLRDDHALRRRLGEEASRVLRSSYSLTQTTERYIEIYRDALSRSRVQGHEVKRRSKQSRS